MVRRAPNGKDLFWLQDDFDGDGSMRVEVRPGAPDYGPVLQTEDLQNNARIHNKTVLDNWRTAQKNYQLSVDAGRGDTVKPPEKPPLVVVPDPIKWPDGQVTAGEPDTLTWP